MKLYSTLAIVALSASFASAQVLFNNHGTGAVPELVTHPGAGPGGVDVSMTSSTYNVAGSAVLRQGATGPHFRIADDFTVTGPGWDLNAITVFAYQTGQAAPGWTGFNMNIWSGAPNAGGTIVGTSTLASFSSANINRVFNGAANLTNTDRRVQAITFNLAGLTLAPGTYWIDWQVEGGASAWAPTVTRPNPANPNAPIDVFGNGLQMTTGGVWQFIGTGSGVPQGQGGETPFIVYGQPVPEPGTMLALAAGLGAIAARRRRKKA
jgi:hypothetical protein